MPIGGVTVLPNGDIAAPAAWWTANNPVLPLGDEGIETDTGNSKTGDGITGWTALAYYGASGAIPAAAPTGNTSTDTANVLTAISKTVPSRASNITVVDSTAAIEFRPGTYALNADALQWRNLQGIKVEGQGKGVTTLQLVGTGTNGLDLDGIAEGRFSDLTVLVSVPVTNVINWHWGDYPSGRSCTEMTFENVDIQYNNLGTFITGFAVGSDLPGQAPQVDSGLWIGCTVSGSYPGNHAAFTNGWLFGNGTAGNNYDHTLLDSDSANCQYNVRCNNSGFWYYGGQPGGNLVDFYFDSGVNIPCTIQSVQSQLSSRFFQCVGGGSGQTNLHIEDVIYVPAANMASDGQFIVLHGQVAMTLEHFMISAQSLSVTPYIKCNTSTAQPSLSIRNCAWQNTWQQAVQSDWPLTNVSFENFTQLNSSNVPVLVTPKASVRAVTTLTGTTAGNVQWVIDHQQGFQVAGVVSHVRSRYIFWLNGYENTTATAQTITFPLAFGTAPIVTASPGVTLPTATATTLTLPASMGSAQTGLVIVEGV